jgi:endonuclease-3
MQTQLQFACDSRLPEIEARLTAVYGRSRQRMEDPLRQLVYALISDGAAPSVGLAVFSVMNRHYPSWAKLKAAEPRELESLFVGLPRARHKAEIIPRLLATIEERRGVIDLDFLGRMTTESARRWLEELPGVDRQLASAVLTFSSLKRAGVPLDAESARPVRRLGLCPEGAAMSAVPRHLLERAPADWTAETFGRLGEGLRQLSRDVCHQGRPECERCVLAALCPSAKRAAAPVVSFPSRAGQDPVTRARAAG